MKMLTLVFLLAQSAFAAPEIVPSPLDHLFVPDGFDSNDSVEMVVTGNFPNVCYSRNSVIVKVKDDLIDIKITSLAPDTSVKGTRACPDMIVPFKEVVSVGNLQGGEYKVQVNTGTAFALKDKLKVIEASSSAVDDNIYGAIEWVEKKGQDQYLLQGWRYSPCFELDQIKVVSNNKDTLSILPIMKQVSDFCPMKGVRVTYPVKLNFKNLKNKQALLHVRTMDGKSVNTIVDLKGR
jgi:hypothetical protein